MRKIVPKFESKNAAARGGFTGGENYHAFYYEGEERGRLNKTQFKVPLR